MDKFTIYEGLVAPLDRANVDTDAIIPKQFLKSIHRSGFGPNLFDEWRYLDHGEPGQDNSRRPLNPEFVLNEPRYQGASILLTRKNFGCGSSREHAPWALDQYGFRAIIAPSFADIFFNNCYKNGLLPIVLSETQVDHLFNEVKAFPGYKLVVDLEQQRVLDQQWRRIVSVPDRRLPQVLPDERPRRYRSDPAPCRRYPRLRRAPSHEPALARQRHLIL